MADRLEMTPRSVGEKVLRVPPNVPKGVRFADKMTISSILELRLIARKRFGQLTVKEIEKIVFIDAYFGLRRRRARARIGESSQIFAQSQATEFSAWQSRYCPRSRLFYH